MKIMTFNILHCMNYKTKKICFEDFAREIQSYNAGFVGLNEVRGKGFIKDYTAQAKKLGELTGMNHYFGKAINVMGVAPYGNAFLSSYPVISAQTIKIPDPSPKTGSEMYESRALIKAVIDAGEKYTFIVTHMGLNLDERENAVKTILAVAPEEKCIIMGDFNCTPESAELKPLFEKYNCSDTETLTFPSDSPRIKIDYIFTSKDIEVIDRGTTSDVVSDHLGQWIEIKEN